MHGDIHLSASQACLAALCVAQKLGGASDATHAGFIAQCPALAGADDAARGLALASAAQLAADIIDAPDGVDTLLELIAAQRSPQQAEIIYISVADFIAVHGRVSPEEMRFLERLGDSLNLDRLTRAAFDRAAQARAGQLEMLGDD